MKYRDSAIRPDHGPHHVKARIPCGFPDALDVGFLERGGSAGHR